MNYDSVEDLASGKWLPNVWGEQYTPSKLEKAILRSARQLETLLEKYLKSEQERLHDS